VGVKRRENVPQREVKLSLRCRGDRFRNPNPRKSLILGRHRQQYCPSLSNLRARLSIFTPRSPDSFNRAVKRQAPFCFIHRVRGCTERSARHITVARLKPVLKPLEFPLQSVAHKEFNLRDDAWTRLHFKHGDLNNSQESQHPSGSDCSMSSPHNHRRSLPCPARHNDAQV
jgi:hypothetical protein